MSFDTTAGKALIASKTFWGVVAMTLAVFAPRFAPALSASVDDAVAVVGAILAIIGRFTASQPITAILWAAKKPEN